MSRRGILIMMDSTPHDWFSNGKLFSLHLTLDDATGEILSGWFMLTECILGYCYACKIMFENMVFYNAFTLIEQPFYVPKKKIAKLK